jgi:hypothetical protein
MREFCTSGSTRGEGPQSCTVTTSPTLPARLPRTIVPSGNHRKRISRLIMITFAWTGIAGGAYRRRVRGFALGGVSELVASPSSFRSAFAFGAASLEG